MAACGDVELYKHKVILSDSLIQILSIQLNNVAILDPFPDLPLNIDSSFDFICCGIQIKLMEIVNYIIWGVPVTVS